MDTLSSLERFAADDPTGVRVDADRCVHSFDAFATCRVCVDECPAGALAVNETITFDAERCSSCGACGHVCPTGVFDIRDETENVLRVAARVRREGAVALLCAAHPPIDRGLRPVDAAIVTEGCLAALGPSTYSALAALGVTQIDVYLDACADCPLAPACASIERTLDKARGALRPWLAAEQITAITELPDTPPGEPWAIYLAGEPPVERRRLLNPFAASEGDDLLEALSFDLGEQPGGKRLPTERIRLLSALALLPPAWQMLCPAPLAGQIFQRIGADEGCTMCGACAKACPTGAMALDIDNESNTFHLTHLAAACTGCGACLDLCDPDVLYSRGVPFFSALQAPEDELLAEGRFVRCKRCKSRVVEGALNEMGLCDVCAFRRANPFGTRIPDRIKPLLKRQVRPQKPAQSGYSDASTQTDH
jgi:ferredoxin